MEERNQDMYIFIYTDRDTVTQSRGHTSRHRQTGAIDDTLRSSTFALNMSNNGYNTDPNNLVALLSTNLITKAYVLQWSTYLKQSGSYCNMYYTCIVLLVEHQSGSVLK